MNETNEPISEHPIVDSFLEELLSEKHPPDLSQSILNRLRDDNDASLEDWEAAVNAALGSSAKKVPSTGSKVVRKRASVGVKQSAGRWAWGVLGVIAASGLLFLASWMVNPEGGLNKGTSVANVPVPKQSTDLNDSDLNSSKGENPNQRATIADSKTPKTPQALSTENVPFATEEPSQQTKSIQNDISPTYKIAASNIVDVINQQFESMWTRNGVTAAKEIESEQWLRRATNIVVGRDPNEEEIRQFRENGDSASRMKYVSSLSDSGEFARHWAWRLSDAWLGPKSRGDRSPQRLAFEEWVASQIAAGTPLKKIQKDLLLAVGSDSPNSSDFHPETHFLAVSYEGSSAKLAERVSMGMLDQSLACSKCHDGKVAKQGTYWGAAAALSQIGVESTKENEQTIRKVRMRKPVDTFYERKDGSMASAAPTQFDGSFIDAKENPLTPMTEWLEKSGARRLSTINTIWNSFFGQRLVPVYGIDDSQGATERKDLQQFLAQQWNAHGEDVRQLVVWIAASKPFAVGSSDLTQDQYFLASEPELESWRRADRQMAFYSAPYPNKRETASNARVAELAQWTKKDRDDIRAQPSDMKQPLKVTPKVVNRAADHVRLFVHARGMDPMLEQQLDAWLQTKMTWDQLVEHASLVSRGQSATTKFQELASDILNQSSGDRKTALSRILLTELGYY